MIDPGTPWRQYALCAGTDPEVFFPQKQESPSARAEREQTAKEFCRRCPVAAECLEAALVNDERYGVFAGTSPEERAVMRDARGMKPTSLADDRDLVSRHERQVRYVGNAHALARVIGVTPEALAARVKRARRNLREAGGAA